MDIKDFTGNKELLKKKKTAFLCSREIPASIVLKCYDWAIEQRKLGKCVISGFHSQIEKDVFHYLLKGNQPIIIAMARGLKKRIEPDIKQALDQNRILIISPFDISVKRITAKTAMIRNQLMIELADKITIGYLKKDGSLDKMIRIIGRKIDEVLYDQEEFR